MRDLAILFVYLLPMLARLMRRAGNPVLVAELLLVNY